MAVDRFYAIDRAADFPAATRGFHLSRIHFLVDAASPHTHNRCGILIFVSMAEHYARVIADEGIAQKVVAAEWQAAIDALISQIRDGQIAAGFVAAIECCGAVLAAKAPPDGSADELPDRLYVM
jgi:putative membrane protein